MSDGLTGMFDDQGRTSSIDEINKRIKGGLITDPLPAKVRKLEERVTILESFAFKMIQGLKVSDPKFSKVVDNHFWELSDGP